MEQLDAYWLTTENMLKVVRIDAVLADETFKDMKTFGSEDVYTSILEKI
jgi:hypothetical protein